MKLKSGIDMMLQSIVLMEIAKHLIILLEYFITAATSMPPTPFKNINRYIFSEFNDLRSGKGRSDRGEIKMFNLNALAHH